LRKKQKLRANIPFQEYNFLSFHIHTTHAQLTKEKEKEEEAMNEEGSKQSGVRQSQKSDINKQQSPIHELMKEE
jgi:hypothetical protein